MQEQPIQQQDQETIEFFKTIGVDSIHFNDAMEALQKDFDEKPPLNPAEETLMLLKHFTREELAYFAVYKNLMLVKAANEIDRLHTLIPEKKSSIIVPGQ